ncbi:MAG: ATP-binding cassette domain-containing protein [Burkholderiales bacterium]
MTAVDGVNLRVPDGAYCCFLGPSGCGKTTILRMIAGHEDPTGGEILIGGENVVGLPPVSRRTAMMFQSYALFSAPDRARQHRVRAARAGAVEARAPSRSPISSS